jgi:ubiquitin-small subunit ribosomal protein S27Ae
MADKKAPAKKDKKTKPYKKGRNCPRCGSGTKLAEHKDRYACGKCGYYEKRSKE